MEYSSVRSAQCCSKLEQTGRMDSVPASQEHEATMRRVVYILAVHSTVDIFFHEIDYTSRAVKSCLGPCSIFLPPVHKTTPSPN